MRFKGLLLSIIFLASGCAVNTVYDPVAASTSNTILLLNQSSLASVKVGMKSLEVHNVMGETLTIGYAYANANSKDYAPVTIPNPYRSEDLKVSSGQYHVEYYVVKISKADGVVSDNELIPMIFQDDILKAIGWDALKRLQK